MRSTAITPYNDTRTHFRTTSAHTFRVVLLLALRFYKARIEMYGKTLDRLTGEQGIGYYCRFCCKCIQVSDPKKKKNKIK